MGADYSNFVRENVDAKFIDAVITQGGDWRNDAVNQLLDKVPPCDHVLFLEQDFLIRDNSFFDKLFEEDHNFIYYVENDRKHPAFMAVKRSLIEQTRKNFSASPPFDHFGLFTEDLKPLAEGKNIEEFGVKFKEDYYHMAGLTQNYKCFKYGDPFFRPNTFFYFNWKSTLLPNQSPFLSLMEEINHFPRPKLHEFLDKFFPE